MSMACGCTASHHTKRLVVTGGPGAGKTAVLELLSHEICSHVVITKEAAGILFSGGFPRAGDAIRRAAAQRAIYHVQLELEAIAATTQPGLIICDRGIVDGSAYWPGPGDFWPAVGGNRAEAFARYDAVVHLRAPSGTNGYGYSNPLRIESAEEAMAIDERILAAWDGHPRRFVVEATADFVTKAEQALAIIRREIPSCCARGFRRAAGYEVTTSTGHSAPATTDPTTLPRTAGITLPMP
ncbi:MAG TPA: ATP-binding protein [Gemmatimonadaceae bacterium]|nr:ATP-binding protein [Gemmatimonadaceae bacterium]